MAVPTKTYSCWPSRRVSVRSPSTNSVPSNPGTVVRNELVPSGFLREPTSLDHSPKSKTVLYEEQPREQSPGEHVFELLTGSEEDASPTVQRFRAPDLGHLEPTFVSPNGRCSHEISDDEVV